MSDDYLLTERLPSVHAVRSMVTHVEVSGDAPTVRHRMIRFVRIVGVNEGWAQGIVTSVVLAGAGLLLLPVAVPLLTLGFAAVYRRLGLAGPDFLFAYPGVLILPVVTVVAVFAEEFEWGGRRCHYPDSGAVTVLGSRYGSEEE
jgi:hypothetical protein